MSETLTHDGLPPITMTYTQLYSVLYPIVRGYPWGEGTIHDLWILGAPMPPSRPGAMRMEEERLIVPSQLMAWLSDVLPRMGRPLDDAARLYADMFARSE